MTIKKIVVGVSGGVDSAVSALLLKNKGFEVIGAFMRNWDEIDEAGQCSGEKDFADAEYVCRKLDIPLFQVNFVKDYWNNVFLKFLEDYKSGLTPNPDLMCNKTIKFDIFYDYSKKTHNADCIATGHYARTSFGQFLENSEQGKNVKLLQAYDKFKDQTFFLSGINQRVLKETIFPLGRYHKNEIKSMAKKAGLEKLALKKESTGICFIGKRNFQDFIQEYIEPKPGNFIDIDTGDIVGQHIGIHAWTVGQRCRIASFKKPYFVAKKLERDIMVASGTDHPALYSNTIIGDSASWISDNPFSFSNKIRCQFRFQHTKPLVPCTLELDSASNKFVVNLDNPLRAVTPGQFGVFYKEEECLGCVRIINSFTK
ncbi:TRMU family protein [Megaselia abdita]